jgi:hypothetical protein
MSDEKETKLSQDDLKPVAGGKPAAKDLSTEELSKVAAGIDGLKGEWTDRDHKDS